MLVMADFWPISVARPGHLVREQAGRFSTFRPRLVHVRMVSHAQSAGMTRTAGNARTPVMSTFTIYDLEQRIGDRAANASAEESYTRKLIDRGVAHCAKKFGEEAVETVLAAVGEDRASMTAEVADVIYHLLIMLKARGITLAEVEAVLAERQSMSGLQEKALRKGT
jgi:phosphoribosyl-ATP pyrophosphohydrolase